MRAALLTALVSGLATANALVLCTSPDGKIYAGDNPPPDCQMKGQYYGDEIQPSDASKSSSGLSVTIERSSIQLYVSKAVVRVENVGTNYYRSLVLDCAALVGSRKVSPVSVFISGDQYGPWRPGFFMTRELLFSTKNDEKVSGFTCEAHGQPGDSETAGKLSQH